MNKINDVIKILTMKINENNKRQLSKNIAMSVIVCISAGLFQTADQLMYEDKAAYYKRSGIDRRRR